MNELKLRMALAKLQAFVDNLPPGSIEERYVNLYHALLTDIQNELGQDFSYFRIPASELRHESTGSYPDELDQWHETFTERRYCEREMFMINLRGATNFINSFSQGTGRRPIGFTQTE